MVQEIKEVKNLIEFIDDFSQEIKLQEAATDKLIMSDAMSNKRPKVVSLQNTFKNLFPEKEEIAQSPEEITRRMRTIMKSEKNM